MCKFAWALGGRMIRCTFGLPQIVPFSLMMIYTGQKFSNSHDVRTNDVLLIQYLLYLPPCFLPLLLNLYFSPSSYLAWEISMGLLISLITN